MSMAFRTAPTSSAPSLCFLFPPATARLNRARFLSSPVRVPTDLVLQGQRGRDFSGSQNSRRFSPIVAVQPDLFKVAQTAWKIGKDVTEAGTNLVPDTVPRPIARIGVATVAVAITIFLLKSFISTAFFVLAMMGIIYFAFVAFNSEEISKSSGANASTEEETTLEEARRIMEKYK